jgi:hypothetical protein
VVLEDPPQLIEIPMKTPALRFPFRGLFLAGIAVAMSGFPLAASDHADPIDILRTQPLEPVITDLFVFPVDKDGKSILKYELPVPAKPNAKVVGAGSAPSGKNEEARQNRIFVRKDNISLAVPDLAKRDELTNDERKSIHSLIVIVCVRRALTKTKSLNLTPYNYRIHLDTHTPVSFEDTEADHKSKDVAKGEGYKPSEINPSRPTGQEARARYGGLIEQPGNIGDDVLIKISLNNDASLSKMEVLKGLKKPKPEEISVGQREPDRISIWTGVRDDPFIFPAFFGTNVVAMVLSIPVTCFDSGVLPDTLLAWATSHRGETQIDHVGRSLRTQNPRFDLLNTIPPSQHVSALKAEHASPGLMRDFELWAGLNQLAAYREWDFFPDVMIYSSQFPVGFPNGRLLEDDVAALLAQHGDTLLLELSHHRAQWPRMTTNDKEFHAEFPYLADPWADSEPAKPYQLSTRNTLIVVAVVFVVIIILVLAALQLWQIIRRLLGLKSRQKPL